MPNLAMNCGGTVTSEWRSASARDGRGEKRRVISQAAFRTEKNNRALLCLCVVTVSFELLYNVYVASTSSSGPGSCL